MFRMYTDSAGLGTQISVSHSTTAQGSWGLGSLAAGMDGGLVGIGGFQTEKEKETIQCLNDHLTSYLERVRSLKADSRRLES